MKNGTVSGQPRMLLWSSFASKHVIAAISNCSPFEGITKSFYDWGIKNHHVTLFEKKLQNVT